MSLERPCMGWILGGVLSLVTGLVPVNTYGAGRQDTSLVEAATQNDTTAVRALLQKRVDVNAPQPDGTVALHWAAHHGNVEASDLLIRAGAKVAAANRYGVTPLWLAGSRGHVAVVGRLLSAGADPHTTRADSGETVLMIAARAGHADVVKLLLAHGATVNATETVRGQTALMWAAAEQHPAVVQVLVDAGADLTARSKTGLTPLMFAIRAGDIESTRLLLAAGADLNETAPDGTTMLVLAILNARFELAAQLLDHGADPNVNDPHGRPLHVLAWMRRADSSASPILPRTPSGNLDTFGLARALLAHGANINDRIDWKDPAKGVRVPEHMAIGRFVNTTLIGATPFYIAALNCDVPFMKFLAVNGADPLIPTVQQMTPLLAAAGVGWTGGAAGTVDEALEAVKVAYELANDPKAVPDFSAHAASSSAWDGASALHGAVIRGAKRLAEWLIDKGVPLDLKAKNGETALNWAEGNWVTPVYSVQPELAALLRQKMLQQGLPVPPPATPAIGTPKNDAKSGGP